MRLLLDTHVLLWWLDDSPNLSAAAKEAIADPGNIVAVSVASLWEIAIKKGIGKLDLPDDFEEVLSHQGFELLDVKPAHTFGLHALPLLHRDPFDRMLVAQARAEGLRIVTRDTWIQSYDVPVLDA